MKVVVTEEWKDVTFCDRYLVSNLGNVKRKDGQNRVLTNTNGYLYVSIPVESKFKMFPVHHLVALAFIGPREEREINHKDGDRGNNVASNLEWVTHKENERHKRLVLNNSRGGSQVGSENPVSKITENDVFCIREAVSKGSSLKDQADFYGIHPSVVGDICNGTSWKHVGGPLRERKCIRTGNKRVSSTLLPEDIPKIRGFLQKGRTYKEIGEKYGVHGKTIGRIEKGVNWKDVQGVDMEAIF